MDRIYEGILRYGRPAPDYGMSDAHTVTVRMSSAEADFNFLEMILYHEDRPERAMPVISDP
jgi:ATP-dependent DNA helicase RecG